MPSTRLSVAARMSDVPAATSTVRRSPSNETNVILAISIMYLCVLSRNDRRTSAALLLPNLARPASMSSRGAAPAGQVVRDVLLGERQGFFECAAEVLLHCFLLDVPAQKVTPEKFSERNGFLGKSSGPSQLAGEGSEGIIAQVFHGSRQLGVRAAAATLVIGMQPAPVVHDKPKCRGV